MGVLVKTTLYREGYHCKAGYYGVKDKCVKCAEDFSSFPGSITCFPVTKPADLLFATLTDASKAEEPGQLEVGVMSDYVEEAVRKEWEATFSTNINVKIGVIIGIILLLALAVTSVTFTIRIARRCGCI